MPPPKPKDSLQLAPGAIQGQVLSDNSPGLLEVDPAPEGFHVSLLLVTAWQGLHRRRPGGRQAVGSPGQPGSAPPPGQGGGGIDSSMWDSGKGSLGVKSEVLACWVSSLAMDRL